MPNDRFSVGSPSVDRLLGGGVESDGITELYGEGGSGKTLLCVQMAVGLARAGRWVAYVDTEGVSVSRLEAIAGDALNAVLDRLLLSTPGSLEEQGRAVSAACRLAESSTRRVGLIVLDSATLHYRLALGTADEDEARLALERQLADLLSTALRRDLPVLITNQVWRRLDDGVLEPLGGSFVNHVAKTILRLDRLTGNRRRATLVKHRSLPEASVDFRITPTGLE